ncbi:BA75_04751T0 [Komagataella pastoris]|uniref:BA75_04751T0 n=1 Tax=Komagataella pastoris TaxID=4922 RepID=A0A1B2JH50_PICPA|nr:BA75_04751T0 [Komagataella pastoris]
MFLFSCENEHHEPANSTLMPSIGAVCLLFAETALSTIVSNYMPEPSIYRQISATACAHHSAACNAYLLLIAPYLASFVLSSLYKWTFDTRSRRFNSAINP